MMESVWHIGLIALWFVMIVNLLLTLRVVRWLRSIEELRKREADREDRPQLEIGAPAPDFRAKTLAGETVGLHSYAGHAAVFVFVSPHCGGCRRELPELVNLGTRAKARAHVNFVLVSDASATETNAWLNTIREEDGVDVPLSMLVALPGISDFTDTYNPRGFVPYYCYLDVKGVVQARDPLGRGEWDRLRREWEGPPPTGIFARSLNQRR